MDQKQRLIDIYTAALEEFSEFGYSKATLNGVASRLGMTKGNLYFFIRSKTGSCTTRQSHGALRDGRIGSSGKSMKISDVKAEIQ